MASNVTAFSPMLKAVQDFNKNIDIHVIDAARQFEKEIILLNTEKQLYEGYRSDGTATRPRYTGYTSLIKGAKGQITEWVTLKDTGAFYKAFKVLFGKDNFEITSTDEKTDKLVEKYTPKIFGLDEANIGELNEQHVKPELQRIFRDQILTKN